VHDSHYGRFGGRFVPEVLTTTLDELEAAFDKAQADVTFAAEMDALRRDYGGRPP
jgi:tryptophan synthase beta chain